MIYCDFMRKKLNALNKYKTASGYPCTFTGKASELENYTIYGNTVDGVSVGDKTSNLCDVSKKLYKSGSYTFTEKNQEFSSVWGNASAMLQFKMSVKPNTKYTVYYDVYTVKVASAASSHLQLAYDGDSVNSGYIVRIPATPDSQTEEKRYQSTYTLTTKSDATELYIYVSHWNANIRGRLMVAEAESITEYEPFGYKIPIKINNILKGTAYTQLPLNKTNTDVDYLDYKRCRVINYIDGIPTAASAVLPTITAETGTNVVTTGTTVEPSNIKIRYKG